MTASISTRSSRSSAGPSTALRFGCVAVFALIATIGAAQAADCPDVPGDADLADARGTARRLYGTDAFFEARGTIDALTIAALERDLTAKLAEKLRLYASAVAEADRSADTLTKAPYPEGPIFVSNYEGMDGFAVLGASAGPGGVVKVKVGMTYASPIGAAEWDDVAVLVCEGGAWKLDDVLFDPDMTAGPSLSLRLATE